MCGIGSTPSGRVAGASQSDNLMNKLIPAPVLALISGFVAEQETHASLDRHVHTYGVFQLPRYALVHEYPDGTDNRTVDVAGRRTAYAAMPKSMR